MSLPNKEEFEEFLELAKWQIPKDILYKINGLKNPSKSEISELVNLFSDARASYHFLIDAHKVFSWLDNQPNYRKAIKSLSYRSRNRVSRFKNLAEVNEYRVNAICEDLENNKLYALDFERHFRNSDYLNIAIGIIERFYKYLHTERAEQVHLAKNKANEIVKQAEESFNNLLNLAPMAEFSNESKSFFVGNGNKRILEKIRELKFSFPVERYDATLKERVFIYDLNQFFNRYFRTSKSNAIFYLLMLEGVINNIEKRSIERMLAKWKADSQSEKMKN